MYSAYKNRGAIWGRSWGRVPPLIFHTWAKDMSLKKSAKHFTLGIRPCIISSFLLQIYLRPPLRFNRLRP